jgi:hypothetical protein
MVYSSVYARGEPHLRDGGPQLLRYEHLRRRAPREVVLSSLVRRGTVGAWAYNPWYDGLVRGCVTSRTFWDWVGQRLCHRRGTVGG